MRINDLCGDEIAAWIESPVGEPTMMGTSGVLRHPGIELGHYGVGESTYLGLEPDAAIARHVYGLCFRERASGMAIVLRWREPSYD